MLRAAAWAYEQVTHEPKRLDIMGVNGCLDVLFVVSYRPIKFLQILSTMLHRPAATAWICVLAECEQPTHKSELASPTHTLTTSSMHSQMD